MKCRKILPVGLLTYLVCFGGVNASALDWLRLVGDEAVLEEPAPLESDGGKLDATQKGMDSACQKSPACQKSFEPFSPPCRPRLRGRGQAWGEAACGAEQKCGPVSQKSCGPACQKGAACQKNCEPFSLSCRPRLRGWGQTCGEPACGAEQKCGMVSQKDCGPVCQKGPACQKSCEPFSPPCRPRLRGRGQACCEPACGVEQKCGPVSQKDCGPVSQKGPACQKSCEPFSLPCRPRVRSWSKIGCETATCWEPAVQKGGWSGAEQKTFDGGKGAIQKAAQK